MSPQGPLFLDKAERLLDEARAVLGIGLTQAAGRAAYLSAFHVAQAVIFEATGRVRKTHSGVQSEFARVTHNDPRVDVELRRFLSQTYRLKSVADYETGPATSPSVDEAQEAIANAERFLRHFRALL